jgi:hypothetical protein
VRRTFNDLLNDCDRTAFKLEFRDGYMTEDPGYVANEINEAPEVVKLCSTAFTAAWARAIDHADFSLT